MKQKIAKSEYLYKILAFQQAFSEEEHKITFERTGLDNQNHFYQAKRYIKEKKWCFSLSQDGKDIDYPYGSINNIDEIIEELVKQYREISLSPHDYIEWDVYFAELARADKSKSQEIEILAAWFETIQRLGLLSSVDVREIAAQKFPEEDMKKFNERIINEEIKNGSINQQEFQTPIQQRKPRSLLINKDSKYAPNETLNAELEEYCRNYISYVFKKRFEEKTVHKRASRSPIYNEPAFRLNLDSYYQKILHNVQERIIPMFIRTLSKITWNNRTQFSKKAIENQTSKSETGKEAFEFLKEQINYYIQDKDDKKENTNSFCWYLENYIGMGKTTFVEKLYCDLANEYLKNINSAVPLLIHAKDIKGPDFSHWFEVYFKDDVDFLNALRSSCKIKKRKLILIIDGLDELNYQILESLLDLCASLLSENVFLLFTSRPIDKIDIKVNDKLSQSNYIELYYKNENLYELLDFPNNLSYWNKYHLLPFFLDSSEIIDFIKSPLLFKLISNYLNNLYEKNGKFNPTQTFPISLSLLIKEYYKTLTNYSKFKGVLSPNVTLREIIEAGKLIAKKLFFNESLSKYEKDLVILKKIGLIVGDIENPQFCHLFFEYDFLARAISSGNPLFTPKEIFEIISLEKSLQFNIAEYAIRMVLLKTTDKDDMLLDISNETFDLFENLYEDNSLHFSKLKAIVWKARGKGPTPLINYAFNYILNLKEYPKDEKDLYFIFKRILNHINISFPNYEHKLLEQNDIKFLIDLGVIISDDNIPLFIEKIKEFRLNQKKYRETDGDNQRENENNIIRSWMEEKLFKSILWSKKPLSFLIDLIPDFFFDIKYILAIDMIYKDQRDTFYQKLFLKLCDNPDREILSEYLEFSSLYPFLIPNLNEMNNKNRISSILSSIFLENDFVKKLKFSSENYQRIINFIFQNALSTKNYNMVIEIFKNYGNYFDSPKFINTLKECNEIFRVLIEFFEDCLMLISKKSIEILSDTQNNSSSDDKIRFLTKIWNWFLSFILTDKKLSLDCVNLLKYPDNVAKFLKEIESQSYLGLFNLKSQDLELWKFCITKLKKLLKHTNPEAYRTLIVNFQYIGLELNKPIEYNLIWCEETDVIAYKILERYNDMDDMTNSKMHRSLSQYYIFSDSALKYIIKDYLNKLLNNKYQEELNYEVIKNIILNGMDSFIANSFFQLLKYNINEFTIIIKEIINNDEPLNIIKEYFKDDPIESFKNSFWDAIFKMIKKVVATNENYNLSTDWITYLEEFKNIPMNETIKEKIMSDDNVSSEFLKLIETLYRVHPSVINFFNTLIQYKPNLVKQYFISNYSIERFAEIVKHYDIFSDFIIDQILIDDYYFSSISDDLQNFLLSQHDFVDKIIKNSAQKNIDFWPYRLNSAQKEILQTILKENENNPHLFDYYEIYLANDPIRWLTHIEEDQNISIEELKKRDIIE